MVSYSLSSKADGPVSRGDAGTSASDAVPPGSRLRLDAVNAIELWRGAIDVQLKNIGTVCSVRQNRAGASSICRAPDRNRRRECLPRTPWGRQQCGSWAQRSRCRRSNPDFAETAPQPDLAEYFHHVLIDRTAGRNYKGFAHLRKGLRIHGNSVAHGIAASREMIGPAHDVNARALGGQREHRQRIEFSPQMRPLIGPNAVWKAPNVSPCPPV